jgi:hypothetical protein
MAERAERDSSRWPSHDLPAYAGVGSRATPPEILEVMARAARALARRGWVLRTGLAQGADQAFYRGARGCGPVELYLPWPLFGADAHTPGEREVFVLGSPGGAALELARSIHPAWERLSVGAQRLHARNCHQLLGPQLDSPARLVICWTPDGSLDGAARRTGGTGQALRIARRHGIAVLNLARPEHIKRVRAALTDRQETS